MSQLSEIRTSLEVGFPEGALPEAFVRFRGRQTRAIGALAEFPYEDGQFDAVLMDGGVVSAKAVREAHRVLRPEGRLFFTVPERTKKQEGYTLPDIYRSFARASTSPRSRVRSGGSSVLAGGPSRFARQRRPGRQ